MVDRDKILGIIRMKGPVLPVQVAKALETSILFASAMLSELVSASLLKVSSVKIGGSPLYYLPEHKSRLQEFSKHLAQKEIEAYDLLKKKTVLRESELEPAIKVALRNMKDYAWPLKVTINNDKEIFWKWYLTTNEDATNTTAPLFRREKIALGLDHAELSGLLMKRWKFPDNLLQPCQYHHNSRNCPHQSQAHATVVELSDHLCMKAGMGHGGNGFVPDVKQLQRSVRMSTAEMDLFVKDIANQRANIEEFLEVMKESVFNGCLTADYR